MIKNILKKIFSRRINNSIKNKKYYIDPSVSIKGKSNFEIHENTWIGKNVKIVFENEGKLILQNNAYINDGTTLILRGTMQIGKDSFINESSYIICIGDIKIGNDVLISPCCSIISGNHKILRESKINQQNSESSGIIIGDDVWIGLNSIILDGNTIKKGSIVGAGSVVTKNINEYEIWAGNPAKFVKYRR